MDDVHVLRHVKSVASAAAVYLMAAVVGQEGAEPAATRPRFVGDIMELCVCRGVVGQSGEGFLAFGAVTVHGAVVVAVVDDHDIVFILAHDPLGMHIAFVGSLADYIVHIALKEYL